MVLVVSASLGNTYYHRFPMVNQTLQVELTIGGLKEAAPGDSQGF